MRSLDYLNRKIQCVEELGRRVVKFSSKFIADTSEKLFAAQARIQQNRGYDSIFREFNNDIEQVRKFSDKIKQATVGVEAKPEKKRDRERDRERERERERDREHERERERDVSPKEISFVSRMASDVRNHDRKKQKQDQKEKHYESLDCEIDFSSANFQQQMVKDAIRSCGEKVNLLRIPEIEDKLSHSETVQEIKEDQSKPQPTFNQELFVSKTFARKNQAKEYTVVPKQDLMSMAPPPRKSKYPMVIKVMCKLCGLHLEYMRNVQLHLKKVHGKDLNFHCPHCPQYFRALDQLTNHIIKMHMDFQDENDFVYICPYTKLKVVKIKRLQEHIRLTPQYMDPDMVAAIQEE